ncbi:MAG: class I SAM-dependent methyltransferase [Actinomycetota bacterium]|nr:class I SAM-dependent methyltransferase [Actinomycetota bacterium]
MTNSATPIVVPWEDWLRRWDLQQGVYIENRERGFDVMFSFLQALLPPQIIVLDLAAGAGSISQRLLRLRPEARSVAVDIDPVMLAIGQGALGDMAGRLRWVRADLRDRGWATSLGEDGFDAVLSATATHWLQPAELAAVYRDIAGLLRPGGILLNADGLHYPRSQPRIRAAVDAVDRRRQQRAVDSGAEAWADWWDALRAEPALQEAFTERDRIFPPERGRIFPPERGRIFPSETRPRHSPPTLAFHEAALLEAGFEEVATVWQDLHKRVLLAFR